MRYLSCRDAGISAVAFHPTRHMAVSSSYGGDFKVTSVEWQLYSEDPLCCETYNFNMIFQVWVCNDEIQQKGQTIQNSGWACLAVGAYKYDHTQDHSFLLGDFLYFPFCRFKFFDLIDISLFTEEKTLDSQTSQRLLINEDKINPLFGWRDNLRERKM